MAVQIGSVEVVTSLDPAIDLEGARPGWAVPTRWLLHAVRAVHPVQRVRRDRTWRLSASGREGAAER